MAIILHVSMNFKNLTATEQVNIGKGIIKGLTNNPTLFPKPPIAVSKLQALNDELAKDNQEVNETGSKQSRADLKESRKDWITNFGTIATYVDMIAQGLQSTIVAGGFTATKGSRQKKAIPGLASGFKAGTNGVKGAVLANIDKPVADATAFVYYALPAGVSVSFNNTTMIISLGDQQVYINAVTQRETEIYTSKSSTALNVGVFALNATGIGPSTDVQQVITQ